MRIAPNWASIGQPPGNRAGNRRGNPRGNTNTNLLNRNCENRNHATDSARWSAPGGAIDNRCIYTADIQDAIHIVAKSISRKTGGEVDADELFSVGECAVAAKLEQFDTSRGYAFKAWACRLAKWAMQDYLRSIDPLTRDERDAWNAKQEARKNAGEEPTKLIVHIDALPPGVSPAIGESQPDRGEQNDDLQHVLALVEQLPSMDAAFLKEYYVYGTSIAAVASAYECSGETVRRSIRRSLDTLRGLARQEARGAYRPQRDT
ncbi:MAG TPA: sigma-70 family RNA polymerase sigma factor [Lacunisphaera sp.]|nr:sigma-70 family RNA polymerase sigma factor [Lacunisphaera sp.]